MKVRSSVRPQEIEVTPTHILIASNITEYEETNDEHTRSGFEYECQQYTKDEYILLMAQQLEAAKILLGVD